jgi:hypothetical protein
MIKAKVQLIDFKGAGSELRSGVILRCPVLEFFTTFIIQLSLFGNKNRIGFAGLLVSLSLRNHELTSLTG